MKKKIFVTVIHLALLSLLLTGFSTVAKAQVGVSFQVFYDQLSPYGSWISYPEYGYVWVPTGVPSGFRPYSTGGHWVYTPDGWTWVSDYSWGWAPFHYGNWFYDQNYGWMWLPDYDWAPAWVTWGEYGDNYCWAPIGPRVSFGIDYRPPVYCWTFVPHGYITSPRIGNYYVSHINSVTIVNRITVINNISTVGGRGYVRGPQPQNVEKFTHSPVRTVTIRAASGPGTGRVQNGELAIYRPSINRNESARPTPSHIQDYHNIRPSSLPARNSQISTQTFAASHSNSPLQRPVSNTPAANRTANPANTASRNSTRQNTGSGSANRPVNHQPADRSTTHSSTQQNPPRRQPVQQNPVQQHPVQQRPVQQHPPVHQGTPTARSENQAHPERDHH